MKMVIPSKISLIFGHVRQNPAMKHRTVTTTVMMFMFLRNLKKVEISMPCNCTGFTSNCSLWPRKNPVISIEPKIETMARKAAINPGIMVM